MGERLHQQLELADRDMRSLERELRELDKADRNREDLAMEERVLSQSSAFANPDLVEKMDAVRQKIKVERDMATTLRKRVTRISKRDAESKYGSGVIRVKVDLVFPVDSSNSEGGENSNGGTATAAVDTGPNALILEMASLDDMPHSVYTFLEMVSMGLIDGCSFILNAMHVLKAAPLPYDGSSASSKARQFVEAGLESVAFREYSDQFPNVKNTVGFAADGSPSFYINTDDNSEVHAGDPCFAKVVSGFDTIERLEKMPTRNGIWLEHRIGIKKATIL